MSEEKYEKIASRSLFVLVWSQNELQESILHQWTESFEEPILEIALDQEDPHLLFLNIADE